MMVRIFVERYGKKREDIGGVQQINEGNGELLVQDEDYENFDETLFMDIDAAL